MIFFVTSKSGWIVKTVGLSWTLSFELQTVIAELKRRKGINLRIFLRLSRKAGFRKHKPGQNKKKTTPPHVIYT